MDIALVIGLIVLGIFFMILEIFFLPGISIALIGGLACLVAGIVVAYTNLGTLAGNITLISSAVAMAIAFIWFIRSKTLKKMSLETNIDATVEAHQGAKVKVGDKGHCISRLAPTGKILIDGKTLEGRSENEILDAGTAVVVTGISDLNVIVRKDEGEVS
jgi:membrane-bound ClpP family serine protease